MENCDVVIAGGAVMGSSVAYHLAARDPMLRILVVEPDPSYAGSASALSAGSIRQQFSSPVNIRISLHGIAFLRALDAHLSVDAVPPDIGLHEGGYLYVAGAAGAALLRENQEIQRSEGADIALLDRAGLAIRFPWLATNDLLAGTYGLTGEGWFDGYGLMMAFRAKARSLGVQYRQSRVMDATRQSGRVEAVTFDDGTVIACGHLVNTAGASGARVLSQRLGFPIPVYAKARSVFGFQCREKLAGFPLLIDRSGVWCRPEGDGYIAGYSPDDHDETDHADPAVDWSLWDEVIWPALAARVPAFEEVRPGRAWAGPYDMCLLDHNALVGRLPDLSNAYLAAGFSGHGLQQSPAVGRGLAELILDGRYTSLDLSDLAPERVLTGRKVIERNVI